MKTAQLYSGLMSRSGELQFGKVGATLHFCLSGKQTLWGVSPELAVASEMLSHSLLQMTKHTAHGFC